MCGFTSRLRIRPCKSHCIDRVSFAASKCQIDHVDFHPQERQRTNLRRSVPSPAPFFDHHSCRCRPIDNPSSSPETVLLLFWQTGYWTLYFDAGTIHMLADFSGAIPVPDTNGPTAKTWNEVYESAESVFRPELGMQCRFSP